ncbi:MAG: choice-of-anchor J domain-containing protein [Bacteroidota bacterium]
MKRLFSVAFLLFAVPGIATVARAQVGLPQLNENFNSNCPDGAHHPHGWVDFNPIPSTIPKGQWVCAAEGRAGTPGIKCSGLWDGAYHLDTAFLISPLINMSSHAGEPIFLRFDSKTTKINLGAKLSIVAGEDSTFHTYFAGFDQALTPVFGNDDSTDWVTHQFDLSGFAHAGDFFLAFRYTSPDDAGSVWFLDNIFTTSAPLEVQTLTPTIFQNLTAVGNSATSEVKLSFSADKTETYDIGIYDLTGREVARQQVRVRAGQNSYTLKDVDANPGIYILKLGGNTAFRTAKFMVY